MEFTVKDARVVKTLINYKGKQVMFRVGIRIELSDGSWWFRSRPARRVHSTWTKHMPGLPLYHRSGTPVMENGKHKLGPERIERFGTDKNLRKSMGHCKALLNALSDGLMLAQ